VRKYKLILGISINYGR